LRNQIIGIIGFGSQASAWALNLRDSNRDVIIYLRPNSKSEKLCKGLGFKTRELAQDNFEDIDHLCLLTPDHTHTTILKNLNIKNKTIILAHGYSYSFENLAENFPELEFTLLAPKAIASEIRLSYETKKKIAALISFEGINSENVNKETEFTISLAKDLGFTCGPFKTTFINETKADLFSEQTILCSMIPYLSLHSYNRLREAGIEKETAYLECFHEIKLIVNALSDLGPDKFFEMISPNALIGSQKGLEYLFDDHFKEKIEKLFTEIDNLEIKKTFEDADINQLKKDVVGFWKKQEFTQTHNEMQSLLKH
jgi:ketol-acid reductoisomerase